MKKFGETLREKTEEVKKAVETSWKKPLGLHEDTVEVMWAATQSDVGIASACKGLIKSLLEIFHTEKGSDRSLKLLSKWLVVTSDILNNDKIKATFFGNFLNACEPSLKPHSESTYPPFCRGKLVNIFPGTTSLQRWL